MTHDESDRANPSMNTTGDQGYMDTTNSALDIPPDHDMDAKSPLLEQAKKYARMDNHLFIGSAGLALLVGGLFALWCNAIGAELNLEALLCVGFLSILPGISIIRGRRSKLDAILEKLASISEKRDLNSLLPFVGYYDNKHNFFHRMEKLLALVEERDAGQFSRINQMNLVRCFTGILQSSETRYKSNKPLPETEEARLLRMQWYAKRAEALKRQKEAKKPVIEADCRFAAGILSTRPHKWGSELPFGWSVFYTVGISL